MKRLARLALGLLLLALAGEAAAATQLTTRTLRLTFDSTGALTSAIACFPACAGENVRLQQFGDAGVIGFDHPQASGWTQTENQTDDFYQLRFTAEDGAVLTWKVPFEGYRIELETSGIAGLSLRSGESFRPREAAGFGTWLEQSRYAVMAEGDIRQIGFDDGEVSGFESVEWVGYRNRYWALMAEPPAAVQARLRTEEGAEDAQIGVDAADGQWSFFLGPVEPRVLSRADPQLGTLIFAGLWFWLGWICLALFHILTVIQMAIPSWGLAIMVLSLIVHVLMLPLSRIADRLQEQVNETEARLAPELQRIKKNYKGEQQSAKILALYKTERVHPLYSLKSMMGVAVVIPVFIGAFNMLAENIHLLNSSFLWISDLSRPDALFGLPFRLPFFGAELNLLPFLMTGLSVLASALHNPLAMNEELRRKQVRNMLILAVAFFVLFYTFPAGMVLYWTTNNLISVIKSLWARR